MSEPKVVTPEWAQEHDDDLPMRRGGPPRRALLHTVATERDRMRAVIQGTWNEARAYFREGMDDPDGEVQAIARAAVVKALRNLGFDDPFINRKISERADAIENGAEW